MLSEVLADADLSHLCSMLSSETLESCSSRLAADGRPAFLTHVKKLGVAKLSDRQKLATVIGKASKGDGSGSSLKESGNGWYSMDLSKEFVVDDFSGSTFCDRLSCLSEVGESPLLPGESTRTDVRKPSARVRLIALYGSGYDANAFDEWQKKSPQWLEYVNRTIALHAENGPHGSQDKGLCKLNARLDS